MTKPWNPRRETVALPVSPAAARPSRIRREPVRLQAVAKAPPQSPEREIAGGVAGILLVAAALATAIVGISAATLLWTDPNAAADGARFGQCYNAPGPDCVVDGGTVYASGQRVAIAGFEAPQIDGAQCDAERERGIEAAMRLAELLNRGAVTVGPAFRDEDGRTVQAVQAGGSDVAGPMIKAGLGQKVGKKPAWC